MFKSEKPLYYDVRQYIWKSLTDNPIGEAFLAVVAGYMSSVLYPSFTDVIKALEAPPMILAVWTCIPIAQFFTGLMEASVFGFLYSISLMFFGFYLNDWGSVITGIIALVAHIAGLSFRS